MRTKYHKCWNVFAWSKDWSPNQKKPFIFFSQLTTTASANSHPVCFWKSLQSWSEGANIFSKKQRLGLNVPKSNIILSPYEEIQLMNISSIGDKEQAWQTLFIQGAAMTKSPKHTKIILLNSHETLSNSARVKIWSTVPQPRWNPHNSWISELVRISLLSSLYNFPQERGEWLQVLHWIIFIHF